MNSKSKKTYKSYQRATLITPQLVGSTILVHNGIKFVPVHISTPMIGHKLGEFSFTRKLALFKPSQKAQKSRN